MRFPTSVLRSFSRINLPLAVLVGLLQRTPLVRTAATAFEDLASSPLGSILRGSVACAASLGAMHSLAGATTLATNSHPSPLSTTAGVPIPTVAFSVIGSGVGAPGSWQVTGAIAPGLKFAGLTSPGVLNIAFPTLTGTPTTAGTFTMQLKAWENPNQKGNVSPLYSYTVVVAAAAVTAPSFTSHPQGQTVVAGSPVTFTVAAAGSPAPTFQWQKDGANLSGATLSTLTIAAVAAADVGNYTCVATNSAQSVTSATATLTVTPPAAPVITRQPATQAAVSGGSVTMFADASGVGATFQWQHNGANLPGATASFLTIDNLQPADAGLYAAVVTNAGGSTTSQPAVLGLATTTKLLGLGTEFPNIFHAGTGFTYDQILLGGAAASVNADPGQILRMSFIDLNDDIVQVEFSGAGTLTLVLEGVTGPAAPVKYNQATNYMKGHAGIVLTGADATTNLSVFSVGRANAVNQALFSDTITYDGFADLAFIAIASNDGKFGGLRAANASLFATRGFTGVYAPGVQFTGPVFVNDINASTTATPLFMIGAGADVRVTGGDLFQANGRVVQVSGMTQLKFTAGSSSQGTLFPAQANQARLEQNGLDVTAQIVVNQAP